MCFPFLVVVTIEFAWQQTFNIEIFRSQSTNFKHPKTLFSGTFDTPQSLFANNLNKKLESLFEMEYNNLNTNGDQLVQLQD